MFGSVASADYDADCYPDLLFESGDDGAGFLYRNRSGGGFERAENFSSAYPGIGEIVTPVFADLNGDGWLDIFSGNLRERSPKILFNDGRGGFARSEGHSMLKVYRTTAGASFADIDKDGDLDLALGHWSFGVGAEDEHLWENRGDGYFFPAGKKFSVHGEFNHRDFTLTPRFVDINNDGYQDILYANDFQQSLLFLNDRGLSFRNVTVPEILSDENAMGSAIADFDKDGDFDWFVSSITADAPIPGGFGHTGNRMYLNTSGGDILEDATDKTGVRSGDWAWGACAADFDNDGNVDLFHTTGSLFDRNVVRDLGLEKTHAQFLDTPSKLYMSNGDGTFKDRALELGLAHNKPGRGIACVDFDRDGDIDIVIANNSGAPNLYRNDIHNGNHSLTIKLIGAKANTEAIGARVYLTSRGSTQMQEAGIRNHYMSQSPTEMHFGLADAEKIDKIDVVWPDGKKTSLEDVAADRYLYLRQTN